MKYILIIGDGMADNPVPQLGGKTPLEAADIPTMDKLASAGLLGSVQNVPTGLPAGSDTAILSIFGCDPRVCYTGRAPLEAAASGLQLEPGDAAFRCNMVTYSQGEGPLGEKTILSHNAGSIDGDTADALIRDLFRDPAFAAAAEKLRSLMLLAHEKLSDHPLNRARLAAGKLPANGIWFWAEGTAVALPSFPEKYGRTGGVISAVPLCHGIAALAGLTPVTVPGATGELETNYEGKARAALDCLETQDFVAVHLEAPDECTHNFDLPGKLQAIENLDRRIIAPILAGLAGRDFRMLILSDHKTLTTGGNHDGTPVPFLLYDSRRDRHTGCTYCERDGEKGPFVPAGTALMGMLFGDA